MNVVNFCDRVDEAARKVKEAKRTKRGVTKAEQEYEDARKALMAHVKNTTRALTESGRGRAPYVNTTDYSINVSYYLAWKDLRGGLP